MVDISVSAVLIAARELFNQHAAPSDDFFSLGGDSATAVEFSLRLEERFGIEVDVELIVSATDFSTLAAELGKKRSAYPVQNH